MQHLTVAVVIEQQGKFLMVQEDKAQGLVWNQPAGHVEAQESLTAAARRECLEETGHLVELQHVIGLYSYLAANGHTYCRVCFAGISRGQVHEQLDPDITQAAWVSHADLASLPMRSPLVLAAIHDFQQQRLFPLSMIHNFGVDA